MLQRQRIYELILGDAKTKDAVKITDLHVSFDITKSSDNKRKANNATIEIYNLSNDTLKKLETQYLSAVISCGYVETGLTTLFVGQVTNVTTRRSGADKITRLDFGEGYIELNHPKVKGIIPAGESVEKAIEEVRKQMPGVSKGAYAGVNKDSVCLFGYPLSGNPRQILNEICETYRLEYRIDRGSLYVSDEAGLTDRSLSQAFVLSKDSGMIDIPYSTSESGTKLGKDKTRRKGVQVKALLNGRIIPGSPIKIESELITGWYKVVNARYYGGFNDNDWYIECFCEEILNGDIPK